jgi:RNA polymerase sigma-70 factor (ECF subfamily)
VKWEQSTKAVAKSQSGGGSEPTSADHSEAVVRLYSQHQRWLFVYLTTLVGNPDHAEDLMQEVCVVMWKEHHRFKLGTNFAAWLSVIAYHQVQKYWRQKKQRRKFLNDAMVEQLAERVTEDFDGLDMRRQMLRECVSKLQPTDQQLLSAVYNDQKMTVRELSRQLERPERALYKSTARIRRLLFECIRRKMLSEGMEVMR